MNEQTPPRQKFPESRLMLGMLSPVLGIFFAVCIFFANVWQPATIGDRIGKFGVEDILFTFVTLCGVSLLASVVGPHRIRPLILRVGGKAARAGVALMLGSLVYILYCCLHTLLLVGIMSTSAEAAGAVDAPIASMFLFITAGPPRLITSLGFYEKHDGQLPILWRDIGGGESYSGC